MGGPDKYKSHDKQDNSHSHNGYNGYANPAFPTKENGESGTVPNITSNGFQTGNGIVANGISGNTLANGVTGDNDTLPPKELSSPTSSNVSEVNQSDTRCGCLVFYPEFLQRLAKPLVYLICICSLVFIQSMVVSGYSSGVLTTIERRYDLSSSDIGFIVSSYDIASLCAGIVVSYYGDQKNRATWLGRGCLLICLGSIVWSLPYFMGGPYVIQTQINSTDSVEFLCDPSVKPMPKQCSDSELVSEEWAFGIFLVAFALVGLGSSPIYSLGATYLYDNVKSSQYPVYAGKISRILKFLCHSRKNKLN